MKMNDTFLNVGMVKKIKLDDSKRAAMLMNTEAPCDDNPNLPLILNRTTRNPELVFNPHNPTSNFDTQVYQSWFPVKKCFFVNCFRYT